MTLCLVAFAAGMRATAQETESTSAPTPQTPSSDTPAPEFQGGRAAPVLQTPLRDGDERVQYVGPDTYILRDAQGRLQSMPGMTYEDFLAAWKSAGHDGNWLEPADKHHLTVLEELERPESDLCGALVGIARAA